MQSIIRHGTNPPTENDLAEHQIGYCSSDQNLYIKDDGKIKVLGNTVGDELSEYFFDSGKLSDKHLWTSKPVFLDAAKTIYVTLSFDATATNQIWFTVSNNSIEDFLLLNSKIYTESSNATEAECDNISTINIKQNDTASFVLNDISSSVQYDAVFEGVAKFDATVVRFFLQFEAADKSNYMIIRRMNISYGSVSADHYEGLAS